MGDIKSNSIDLEETSPLIGKSRSPKMYPLRCNRLNILTGTTCLLSLGYIIYTLFYPKDCIEIEKESLWDKAAVFCVHFVFMICGAVFFVLTCEGPCAVIYNRFQNVQKNTLYEDHDRLVRENDNLKSEIGRLRSIYQEETERLKHDNEYLENRYQEETERLINENTQLKKRVNEEKTEKEKALNRLSTIAGERLRLHNPGIADLSDENRPNKLAEKFSELYDNQWTEALESLNRTGQSERVSVENLFKTLEEIYTTCMKSAQDQRESLIQIITKPSTKVPLEVSSGSENTTSKVIDLQKQTASSAFIDTKNLIIDENPKLAENDALLKYTERSIELCWLMAIQDPPMMLNFGPAQNEDMDTNTFRAFTRTGQKVDFVVWPAVYLYKGGPLVHKGVLEPIAL
ncbi:uncharacterized protein LOC111123105 isoform X2 [Crassostrea virginica]